MITLSQWHNTTIKYNKNIDYDDVVVTYATAQHMFDKWYKKAGNKGLLNYRLSF